MRCLQVQAGEIDDYTTASNICLRIPNKEYCSTRLRILINSLGPRKPGSKFKSSAAPVAIKSTRSVCVGRNKFYFRYRIDKTILKNCKRALSYYLEKLC